MWGPCRFTRSIWPPLLRRLPARCDRYGARVCVRGQRGGIACLWRITAQARCDASVTSARSPRGDGMRMPGGPVTPLAGSAWQCDATRRRRRPGRDRSGGGGARRGDRARAVGRGPPTACCPRGRPAPSAAALVQGKRWRWRGIERERESLIIKQCPYLGVLGAAQ